MHTMPRYSFTTTIYGPVGGTLQTKIPLGEVASDIIGPFKTEEFLGNQNKEKFYLIRIVDRCTRLLQLRAIYKITPDELMKSVEKWIKARGRPISFLTDNGRQYISKETTRYLRSKEIKHLTTVPYSLQSDGKAESRNSTIVRPPASLKHLSIKEATRRTEESMNTSYHKSLGCSPHELTQGCCPLDPLIRKQEGLLNKAIMRAKEFSLKSQQEENRTRIIYDEFRPGQEVMVKSKSNGKLMPKCDGPYRIIERIGKSAKYKVQGEKKLFSPI